MQSRTPVEPGMQTASEVLGTFFDLPRAQRRELVDDEREYLHLRGVKHPTRLQSLSLKRLEHKLAKYWSNDERDVSDTEGA